MKLPPSEQLYREVTSYCERMAKKAESEIVMVLPRMDFQMEDYDGEAEDKIWAAEENNSRCNHTAGIYRDIIYVMEYSYVRKPQEEQDKLGLNRFGQGI